MFNTSSSTSYIEGRSTKLKINCGQKSICDLASSTLSTAIMNAAVYLTTASWLLVLSVATQQASEFENYAH